MRHTYDLNCFEEECVLVQLIKLIKLDTGSKNTQNQGTLYKTKLSLIRTDGFWKKIDPENASRYKD